MTDITISNPNITPLSHPRLSTWGEGRFVYLLGNKINYLQLEDDYCTYEMDRVDMHKGSRIRYLLTPLFGIRYFIGFYAIGENSLILIDYSDQGNCIRQQLITLDNATNTGCVSLIASHPFPVISAAFFCKFTISNDFCYIYSPPSFEPTSVNGFRINKIPNCTEKKLHFKQLLEEINHSLLSQNRSLSKWEAPICLTKEKNRNMERVEDREEKLGFFTDHLMAITADPSMVIVADLRKNSFTIVWTKADPLTNYPLNSHGKIPFDAQIRQLTEGTIGMISTYRYSESSWRGYLSKIFAFCVRILWKTFFITVNINFFGLSHLCLSSINGLSSARCSIMRDPRTRLGILNTINWQWCELSKSTESFQYYSTSFSSFHNGSIVLVKQQDDTSTLLRSVRNPFVMQTLKNLSHMTASTDYRLQKERLLCLQAIGGL